MQGAKCKLPYVRQQRYEWFIAMRYAIDLKKLNAQHRSRGRHKAIGRFPRSLLRTKFHQLQADYCHHCLVNGVKVKALRQRKQRPNGGVPTAQWFKTWGAEYGVSDRKPNRKYKVPRAIMLERCEIGWISVYSVRALCLYHHGV